MTESTPRPVASRLAPLVSLWLALILALSGQAQEASPRDSVLGVAVSIQETEGAQGYSQLQQSIQAEIIGHLVQLGFRAVPDPPAATRIPRIVLGIMILRESRGGIDAMAANISLLRPARLESPGAKPVFATVYDVDAHMFLAPGDAATVRKSAMFLFSRLARALTDHEVGP